MRIVSYNVNGIRAAVNKGLIEWIKQDNADIYCFQELKANVADIPVMLFEELGYHCYWYSAQKKGYSGVGVLTKEKPLNVIYGCGLEQADVEGRVIQLQFDDFFLINTYFPSGSSGEDRQAYKMQFLDEYLQFIQSSFDIHQSRLIITGDYNICHKAIDIHDPKGNKNSSGFLPEEREWMDRFFEAGMIDTLREVNTDPHMYSWWSYRANARANNKGWRIDYISVSEEFRNSIKDATIMPDVMHSDHCPIALVLE